MPRNHRTPKHSKNFQLALQNYTKSLFENNCFMDLSTIIDDKF